MFFKNVLNLSVFLNIWVEKIMTVVRSFVNKSGVPRIRGPSPRARTLQAHVLRRPLGLKRNWQRRNRPHTRTHNTGVNDECRRPERVVAGFPGDAQRRHFFLYFFPPGYTSISSFDLRTRIITQETVHRFSFIFFFFFASKAIHYPLRSPTSYENTSERRSSRRNTSGDIRAREHARDRKRSAATG